MRDSSEKDAGMRDQNPCPFQILFTSVTVESNFRVVFIAQGSNKGPPHCEKSTVELIL